MGLIIIAIICIGLCYKWGDLKNWKNYYPTVLFYIIGDLSHEVIFKNKALWLIQYSFWKDITADYFIAFVIFPFVIIIFLTNFPQKLIQQAIYILCFVNILTVVEYVGYLNKCIFFFYGWNIGWSSFIYMGAFPLMQLHYKKPLLCWFIYFLILGAGVFWFKPSF